MDFAIYTISIKGFISKYYEIYLNDQLVYTVKRPSFFAFGEMVFYDLDGFEVLHIYKPLSFLKHKFEILMGGEIIGTFVKETIENFYTSKGINGVHTIQGDFLNSEYTVFDGEGEIAKISRKRFRSNKKYGIAIIKGHDELYILALVIAISMVNNRKKRKA